MVDQDELNKTESAMASEQEIDVDLAVPASTLITILQQTREQIVIDYNRQKTYARLNDLVENHTLAQQQREQMKKLVLQVHQIDQDLKRMDSGG